MASDPTPDTEATPLHGGLNHLPQSPSLLSIMYPLFYKLNMFLLV